MTIRDYSGEIRAIVDTYIRQSGYTPRGVARDIVNQLRRQDNELLKGWLDLHAEDFMWQLINDIDRARRSRIVSAAKNKTFREASDRYLNGDPNAYESFLTMPLTVADGTRKPLGKLNRGDLEYVATFYDDRAKSHLIMRDLMVAISNRIGNDIVEDHYTHEQIEAIYHSIQDLYQ